MQLMLILVIIPDEMSALTAFKIIELLIIALAKEIKLPLDTFLKTKHIRDLCDLK